MLSSTLTCPKTATSGLDADQQVSKKITSRRTPPSLRPDETMTIGCIFGDANSVAIRDAWRFKFPVTVMTKTELGELSARCRTEFHGTSVAR